METRYKITNALAKFRLRWSRGYGLVDFFFVTPLRLFVYLSGMVVLLDLKFGIKVSGYWILGGIGILMSAYFIGWLDEKWGFWKAENSYQQKDLTPFFQEISEKVDRIAEKVKI